jgi:DNA-binding MarR family transcriptional regulator
MADMDVMLVSQIVRNLEKSGFLTRSENPQDSRSYALHLSNKGKTAVKTALPVVEASTMSFSAGLAKTEKPSSPFCGSLSPLAMSGLRRPLKYRAREHVPAV